MNWRRSIWTRPAVLLGAGCLALHALADGRYGYFRDELYFIVCGDRPDWGYVDQPPIVPLLASWSHHLFGDFLWGFRLLPTVVMAMTVAATAEFARQIGGGRFAQWLAGLCVLMGPVFLLFGGLFYTDVFQPITWLALASVLVRIEQTGEERWWLVFGAIFGFAFNTKYIVVFFLAGLAIGLLFTPQTRSLRHPWIYLGAILAGLMALPNLLWQQAHHWPFLELGKAAVGGKNLAASPQEFLLQQIIYVGPWAAPVWLAGLWGCFKGPPITALKALGTAWIILSFLFIILRGKPYYLDGIYPALLAVGAGRVERWMQAFRGQAVVLGGIATLGALAAPFTLPILPVQAFVRYQKAIGFMPSTGESITSAALPQYYADMFGWPAMAAKIAAVYHALPQQDRARAVFFGNNYGEAAAIDVFGRRLGLPPAISGHNNYWLWGPQGHDGGVIIILGGSRDHYAALFERVDVAGFIDAPYAMPFETNKPIYVLRGMKTPLQTYWPQTKSFR